MPSKQYHVFGLLVDQPLIDHDWDVLAGKVQAELQRRWLFGDVRHQIARHSVVVKESRASTRTRIANKGHSAPPRLIREGHEPIPGFTDPRAEAEICFRIESAPAYFQIEQIAD